MRAKSKMEVDSWSLYSYAFRSPVTKQKYQRSLEKFLDFVGIRGGNLKSKTTYFASKGQNDNTWAFNAARNFLRFQKERVDRRQVTGREGKELC